MRSICSFQLFFVTGSSLSLAQGHMGTPQEPRACSRDARRFADSSWAMMARFNSACSRTGPS